MARSGMAVELPKIYACRLGSASALCSRCAKNRVGQRKKVVNAVPHNVQSMLAVRDYEALWSFPLCYACATALRSAKNKDEAVAYGLTIEQTMRMMIEKIDKKRANKVRRDELRRQGPTDKMIEELVRIHKSTRPE